MLRIAMEQSAWDVNGRPENFLRSAPVINPGGWNSRAKRFYPENIACLFVSYGGGVVVSTQNKCRETTAEYVKKFPGWQCFEAPALGWLDKKLSPLGLRVGLTAEYWLPRSGEITPLPCRYPLRLLEPEDFASLYLPCWSNALCESRKALDRLAVGAYDGDRLIGLSGCSADGERMWQIGVDVLPDYRKQGVAAALTSRLAAETFARGMLPFYCCAWSNVASARNAVRSGFVPAWVEMSVIPGTEND